VTLILLILLRLIVSLQYLQPAFPLVFNLVSHNVYRATINGYITELVVILHVDPRLLIRTPAIETSRNIMVASFYLILFRFPRVIALLRIMTGYGSPDTRHLSALGVTNKSPETEQSELLKDRLYENLDTRLKGSSVAL
jgi:hypothetical protein